MHQAARAGMQRYIARLAALARHPQVRNAAALMPEILDRQFAELLPPKRVVEQGGEDRAIAFALERGIFRSLQELSRLVVPKRRRLTFISVDHRALHALDRVVRDGVAVAEVLEQRR